MAHTLTLLTRVRVRRVRELQNMRSIGKTRAIANDRPLIIIDAHLGEL